MNFFSKFQKYFSFLKLFESPSKNIHVYLYIYLEARYLLETITVRICFSNYEAIFHLAREMAENKG